MITELRVLKGSRRRGGRRNYIIVIIIVVMIIGNWIIIGRRRTTRRIIIVVIIDVDNGDTSEGRCCRALGVGDSVDSVCTRGHDH